jgi:hypothetical protein
VCTQQQQSPILHPDTPVNAVAPFTLKEKNHFHTSFSIDPQKPHYIIAFSVPSFPKNEPIHFLTQNKEGDYYFYIRDSISLQEQPLTMQNQKKNILIAWVIQTTPSFH